MQSQQCLAKSRTMFMVKDISLYASYLGFMVGTTYLRPLSSTDNQANTQRRAGTRNGLEGVYRLPKARSLATYSFCLVIPSFLTEICALSVSNHRLKFL